MQNELIGSGFQILSFCLGIAGATLQRRAMIVEDEVDPDDGLLIVPSDDDDEEEEEQSSFVSTGTSSIVGSTVDVTGRVHSSEVETSKRCSNWRPHRVCHRCRHLSKLWLLGFVIFYSAQIVEIFALNFASQSTIVAVGSLGTFANAVVAVRVFHEPFHFLPPKFEKSLCRKLYRWDLLNLMIIVAGSVCTVIFAPRVPEEEERSFTAEMLLHKWIESPFVYFFAFSAILVSVLLVRFFFWKRGPLPLAVSMGTLAAFSITMSKIVTELVNRDELFNLRSLLMISVWIVLLLSQIILLQIGLRNFEQSGAFSVGGVFGGAMTVMSGMLYYQTYHQFTDNGAIWGFAIGVCMMLFGILVFSQRKNLSRSEMKRRLLADTITLEEEEDESSLSQEIRRGLLSSAIVNVDNLNNTGTKYKSIDLVSGVSSSVDELL